MKHGEVSNRFCVECGSRLESFVQNLVSPRFDPATGQRVHGEKVTTVCPQWTWWKPWTWHHHHDVTEPSGWTNAAWGNVHYP